MVQTIFPPLPAACPSAPAIALPAGDNAVETDGRLQRGTTDLARAATVDWDVIVTGAGPAGALAARQLARCGLRTLLVDKSPFPRAKVCGGCLNGDGVEALRIAGLGHLAEPPDAIPIARFDLCCHGVRAWLNLPRGAAVSRRSFDARLVLAAIDSGADFLPAAIASIGGRAAPGFSRAVDLQTDDCAATARGRIVLAAGGLNQTRAPFKTAGDRPLSWRF
jgi:flavin-dependent dehydrogenase